MKIYRSVRNPLISPSDVKPTRDDYEVLGVFNCGVVRLGDEIILLLRISERPRNQDKNHCVVPVYDSERDSLTTLSFPKADKRFYETDARKIMFGRETYITSISHFRIARSRDYEHFTVEDAPAMFPATYYEAYGIEDPRIVQVGDTYYISYAGIFQDGIVPCLASTKDFVRFERKGIIFAPDNKDVVIFPERIGGKYYALHRPSTVSFGTNNIWLADSDDILCWGHHRQLVKVREGYWDSGRVGASAVPIKTERGWLEIYHGATHDDVYCLGLLLLDLEDPSKVLARSEWPVMSPERNYEVDGFFGNVIFCCGAVEHGDEVIIYYGAADCCVASATVKMQALLDSLYEPAPRAAPGPF